MTASSTAAGLTEVAEASQQTQLVVSDSFQRVDLAENVPDEAMSLLESALDMEMSDLIGPVSYTHLTLPTKRIV